MENHYTIRASFIVEHFQRQDDGFRRRMAINDEAEQQTKRFNASFGLSDDPTSPYATTHNEIGGTYRVQRDNISGAARKRYDADLENADLVDRQQGMTIYEFLLLDNMGDVAKKEVLNVARKGGVHDFIGLRASAELPSPP